MPQPTNLSAWVQSHWESKRSLWIVPGSSLCAASKLMQFSFPLKSLQNNQDSSCTVCFSFKSLTCNIFIVIQPIASLWKRLYLLLQHQVLVEVFPKEIPFRKGNFQIQQQQFAWTKKKRNWVVSMNSDNHQRQTYKEGPPPRDTDQQKIQSDWQVMSWKTDIEAHSSKPRLSLLNSCTKTLSDHFFARK